MADEEAYYLTAEERDRILDYFQKIDSLLANPRPQSSGVDDGHQAPDVYVAVTPDGGIPGLITGIGTGSAAGPGDSISGVECDIYKITGDYPDNVIEPVEDTTRLVFNCGTDDVAGNRCCVVLKDKFGSWLVGGVSGGGVAPLGNEMRLVTPTQDRGSIGGEGPDGIGSGTWPTVDTYYWDGNILTVTVDPNEGGDVTIEDGIYILQRTTTIGPEPSRQLEINGVYLGAFQGVTDLGPGPPHADFRRAYCVVGAPGAVSSHEQEVVTSIDSVTATCNGGDPPTLTVTVNYTSENVRVLD